MSLLLLFQSGGAGTPLDTHSFIFTNGGDADLHVGVVTLESVTGSGLAIISDGASGQTVAPGGTVTVLVKFQPTVAGPAMSSLHVPSDDPDGTLSIDITGNGVVTAALAPVIAVDPPATWDAGTVNTTSGTSVRVFTVTNNGNAPLIVGTVTLTGSSYAKTADTATGATIAPGASKTFTITFDPSSAGTKTGSVGIPSNDAGGTVTVALTGVGVTTVVPPTSVTRFYLSRQTAPSIAGIANSGWARHTTDPDNLLAVAKGGTAVVNGAAVNATGTAGDAVRLGRFISPPLAAQHFASTFRCYITCHRSTALSTLVTSAARFGLWHAASGTVTWGSVLSQSGPVSPWEDPSDPEPRRFPAGADYTWSLDLTFLDGDRLILEPGFRSFAGGATNAARIRWGGGSTDGDLAPAETTQTLTLAPWIDLTGGLLVLP